MRITLPLILLYSIAIIGATTLPVSAQEVGQVAAQQAPAKAKLTNQDVIEMVKSGLKPEIIIEIIQRAKETAFDTAPKSLLELQAADVPDGIILLIVKAAAHQVALNEAAALLQKPEPKSLVIPAGTQIEIECEHTVSSSNVQANDVISFRVISPVRVNNQVVVAENALVTARVVSAKKGRSWGRAGEIIWDIRDVIAIDGKYVPLRTDSDIKGDSQSGEVAYRTGVSLAISAPLIIAAPPLAPIALLIAGRHGFRKGSDAVILAGKRFTVFVREDTTVRLQPNPFPAGNPR